MKSISAINPAIMENTKYSIVKAGASFTDLNVSVWRDDCVSLCLISFLVL